MSNWEEQVNSPSEFITPIHLIMSLSSTYTSIKWFINCSSKCYTPTAKKVCHFLKISIVLCIHVCCRDIKLLLFYRYICNNNYILMYYNHLVLLVGVVSFVVVIDVFHYKRDEVYVLMKEEEDEEEYLAEPNINVLVTTCGCYILSMPSPLLVLIQYG